MSTDGMPAGDRAEWFHDLVSRTVSPHRLAITDGATFTARAGTLSLGPLEMSLHSNSGHFAWRTPQLIRRGDPEHYLLALITQGTKTISQRRTDSRMGAGDVVLWDTSHPYVAQSPASGQTQMIVLHIPRDRMLLPEDRLDAALGSRFATTTGVAAVLREFLGSLRRHADEGSPAGRELLARTTLDLVTGALAQQLDLADHVPSDTRKEITLRRIDAFIDHHLGDHELTPGVIAARHHVSVRTLHALFRSRGEAVAASITRRRLGRCRADLADPDQAHRPVHEIAARWGFVRPDGFSRAFRKAYGISPREYRRLSRTEGTASLRRSTDPTAEGRSTV
ncbi:helix-turn-helix domain-containing protein [Streptomyces sp. NPDC048057]|uniref:AraC-like ligand-binding domain-containing protein n=1 Tax=Streptomyces sp. NPDC048057 TaxID=3155628 RepID=UPI0033F1CC81